MRAGDLLIVNASATIPAALPARRADGTAVDLHLSTPHHEGHVVVSCARDGRRARRGARDAHAPRRAAAPRSLAPYLSPDRLWIAQLDAPRPLLPYLNRHGAPIRYAHDPSRARSSDYQTIFATEPGSAEMPSAARPFTQATLRALRDRGVSVQRITLHTGVSRQERGERPYPERYEVSAHTARRINERTGRVIADRHHRRARARDGGRRGGRGPRRQRLDEPR